MYTLSCTSLFCILVLVSANAAPDFSWNPFSSGNKTESPLVTSSESPVKVTREPYLNGTSTNLSVVGDIYEATVAAIKANETEVEKNKVKDEGKEGKLITTTTTTTPTTSTLPSSTRMAARLEESTTTTSKAPMTNSLSTPSATTPMALTTTTTTTTVKTTSLAPNPNEEDDLKKELDHKMKEQHDHQSQASNTDAKKELKTETTTKVINTAGYGSGSTKPESLVNTVVYFLISCLLYRLSV